MNNLQRKEPVAKKMCFLIHSFIYLFFYFFSNSHDLERLSIYELCYMINRYNAMLNPVSSDNGILFQIQCFFNEVCTIVWLIGYDFGGSKVETVNPYGFHGILLPAKSIGVYTHIFTIKFGINHMNFLKFSKYTGRVTPSLYLFYI